MHPNPLFELSKLIISHIWSIRLLYFALYFGRFETMDRPLYRAQTCTTFCLELC